MEGSTSGLRAGARTESGGRQARPRITLTIRQPTRTVALRAQADSMVIVNGTGAASVFGGCWDREVRDPSVGAVVVGGWTWTREVGDVRSG
jgi:hypothetical protein